MNFPYDFWDLVKSAFNSIMWVIDDGKGVLNVTLDHKTSLKSLGYICSSRQKYIVWVKIIFSFYDKNHRY